MRRRRIEADKPMKRLLAWIGAAVFGIAGVLGLWTAGTLGLAFSPFIQFMTQSESGGLGAVSVGFSEAIGWELAAVLPSIALNRVLVRRVRLEGALIASLHRAQSVLLLAVGALVVLLFVVSFTGPLAFFTGIFVIVIAIALQCLALAGVLGLLARK
jgi:hypothetical protein